MSLPLYAIVTLLGRNGHIHEHPLVVTEAPWPNFLQFYSKLAYWIAMLELTCCLTSMATCAPFIVNEHSIVSHGYSPSWTR